MTAPSISDAFANAPAGTDTTNLQAAFQTLWTALGNTLTIHTPRVANELQDELVRLARIVSVNLKLHPAIFLAISLSLGLFAAQAQAGGFHGHVHSHVSGVYVYPGYPAWIDPYYGFDYDYWPAYVYGVYRPSSAFRGGHSNGHWSTHSGPGGVRSTVHVQSSRR